MMTTGTVRKWFEAKGYGFLQPQEGGADVFVHANQLKRSGVSKLEVGERVEFETAARGDKIEAINVRRIDSGAEIDGNTAPGWLSATTPVAVLDSSASLIGGEATGNVAAPAPRFGD
jgi:CspA family cold shock protein